MMTYEIFKEVVEEKLMEFLPEEYQDMKVVTQTVEKVNKTVDGLRLEGEDVKYSPTIYINDLYKQYLNNENLESVLTKTAATMDEAMKAGKELVSEIQLEGAKNSIVFQLVNTEQNKGLLENIPNREFQDLSILYRWIIKVENEGIQSTIVNNSLAAQLGMSEEELFNIAVQNTQHIFPPTVKSMNEVMKDIFLKDGMSEDMIKT